MKAWKYVLLLIAFIPLLYFRDFTPNNELKYLSIADEAIQNKTFLTFYNHGQIYADKPPLYFWIIMAGKSLLGFHSMLFISLFSLLPALLILYILNRWLSPYTDKKNLQTCNLMLITSGLFMGSAMVLRMDMLMCLFILLALHTFYKIYIGQASPRDKTLLPVYIFMALFTKGPVGLLLPLVSISVFLLLQKKISTFGHYLGWKQWGILCMLCLIWFLGVYAEGGKTYLNNLLFRQTVHRAVDAFHHKQPFWYYFKTIWHSLAPWVLFYLTVILIGFRDKLYRRDIEKFFLIVIVSAFVMLSLFSSKLDIYLLPVFPLIAGLSFLLLPRIPLKTINFSIIVPAILLILAFPASYLLSDKTGYTYPFLLQCSLFLFAGGAAFCLYALHQKKFYQAVNGLAVGLLCGLFVMGFAIPQLNKHIGFRELCEKAVQIASDQHICQYYYYNIRSGENMDIYLQQKIRKIDIKQLEQSDGQEDFVLFIRRKDILRTPGLKELISNKIRYPFTKYDIVIFQRK